MKTRGLGIGILLTVAAGVAALSTGCNSTAVAEKEVVAPPAVMVTNVPPETNVVAGEGAPVQKSVRPNLDLPEDVSRVVQLVESGAGDEVVRAYVGASTTRYDLSLEQIMYLRDIGVSDGVIAAMMRRGSELREKDVEAAAMQTNLVAAVEQIKEGLAAGGYAGTNGGVTDPAATAAPPAPVDPSAGVVAAAPAAPAAAPVMVQATAVPAEAPQPVQQFYTSLSPYGTWYQVPTYGWVWQPSTVVVDRTWMPYRHGGRWVWTDCGWYWCSDYSWGWAPFHYGRWTVYPGLGWCWTPDTVWGPSWVTWRQCDGYMGWAPLPPHCGWSHGVGLTWYGSGISVGFGFGLSPSCYTFVPGRRFGHRNLAAHAVHGRDHEGAFRQSTVINNVVNGNNNVIVNNGVAYTEVAKVTRDEIPKARVQPLPNEANAPLRADRMERGRDGFVVYRPTEVESVGGRPALRSEVRPVSAAGSVPGSRSLGAAPTRAGAAPRFTGTTDPGGLPGKSAETRGSGNLGATAPGARPVPNSRSSVVSGTPGGGRPYSGTAPTRAGEARGAAGVTSGQPVPTANTPSAVVGPRRETAPVPLGNPNRYLPRNSSTTTGAGSSPAGRVVPSRGGNEARGAVNSPSAPASAGAAPAPAARPVPSARPNFQAPTAPQRPSVADPGVRMNTPAPVSRPSYSVPAPAVAAPSRPSYSAPSPASVPAMSAPRPSFSAPSPAVSVPSARPAVASPAPAPASTPSSGGGGTSRNGPRNQQN